MTQLVDYDGELLGVVKALLGLEDALEQFDCLELAGEVEGVPLFLGGFACLGVHVLSVSYGDHVYNLARDLREQAQVGVPLLDLGDVLEEA